MENLTRRIAQIPDKGYSDDVLKVLTDVYNRFRSAMLTTAGLVISGTTTKVKTGAAACYYIAQGILGTIAAATDMPVLVGTVTNAKFNVFVFTVDSAGTTYSAMGTEGGSLAAIRWPAIPASRAIIGMLIVNPTGTGNFVGGTTALGDATVVPNAVYQSPVGSFDPTATVI